MDLLEEIRKKTTALSAHSSLESINAVIRHVEVAERYLIRARDERDDDLFNDVIYRTNQAFEGMLKEVYTVLTDKDGRKLSPHQIEEHLLKANVLGERVLELFKNYRTQWRNPSTHNHTLFFSESEAMLAIVSVSAFANILLNQVIERINFKQEQETIQQKKDQLQQPLSENKDLPLHDELTVLLDIFSDELIESVPDPSQLTEVEINGRLHAFIESIAPDANVVRAPQIGQEKTLRPDFLIQKGNQEVVIETKRAGINPSGSGVSQVLTYLNAGKWQHGILYIPPSKGQRVKETTVERILNGRDVSVHIVAPTLFSEK